MFLKPRNHPGLASSLIDFLRAQGPQDATYLKNLFIPDNLAPADKREGGEGWAGQISFNDTVGALAEADLLVRDDRLALTDEFAEHLGPSTLAECLAPWLLAPERTGEDPSGEESGSRGPTADLAHTITWFMDIDPMGPWPNVTRSAPSASPVRRLADDAGRTLPSDTFDDVSEWARFVRWCVFLGFGEVRPGGGLDPDPTVAIRRVLPITLPSVKAMSSFLADIAGALPVFGGHLELSWCQRSGGELQAQVKPSLANALLRLESSGDVALDPGTDDDDVVIFEFGRFEAHMGPEGRVSPPTGRYARISPGGIT